MIIMSILNLEVQSEDIGGERVNIIIFKGGNDFYMCLEGDQNQHRQIVHTEISKRYRGSGCQYCFHFSDGTYQYYGVPTRDSQNQYANAHIMRFLNLYV